MTYQKFACLYDALMEDVPYDGWVDWVIGMTKEFEITGKKLLDVACGTGELSIRLSKAGFDVTGVDLSEDMLAVAQSKAEGNELTIPFYHQNMTKLMNIGEFDTIGIFCDSLNYLQDILEIERTFAGVYQHLAKGGLFLFDVHSLYKMDVIFQQSPFTYDTEDVSYIWHCFPGQHSHSVEHELTFFVLDDRTGQYDRVDEYHFQRTFAVREYKSMLEKAGFEILRVTADFSNDGPRSDSERILFAARKV